MIPSADPTHPTARWLRAGGEGLLLALANLSAWPFAGIEPFWQFFLAVGVALLTALWATHALLTRQFVFRPDLVSIALAGLLLLSTAQLVPLPIGVAKVFSPARAGWHETLIPAQIERLPGEPEIARPGWITLSANPHDTRTFAARLVVLLAVYTVARHWLTDPHSARRFALVATLNGSALALFALGQFFSAPRGMVYWSIDVGGSFFGPFICRNHYPDYIAFGIGGAICLLRPQGEMPRDRRWQDRLLDIFDRPASLFAALALGLMIASVPFSQSRGGVVSVTAGLVGVVLLAGWRRIGSVGLIGGVAASVTVGLVLWLGIEPITKRFRDDSQTLDDRLYLWQSAATQLPGLWATGSGNGTFQLVEPLGRTTQDAGVMFDHAHNEYLEAATEGGMIRLVLTLLLAIGVPVVLARMYRRLRGRSVGAFVLGVWFAVVVLVCHSAVDFAIHMPAVAIMAAAAVGIGSGVRVRGSRGGAKPEPPASLPVLLLPVLIAAAATVGALDARNRWRAEQLEIAAASADPAARVELLAQRTRVTPADPNAWYALAEAQLEAGRDGAFAVRTARNLCPLHADSQFVLGLSVRRFERADPPLAYFQRATRLRPTLGEAWYARGVEELAKGDRAAAAASWRRSLELSPRRLSAILAAWADRPDEELRDRVLPDDPEVLLRAADRRPAGDRRVYLERAAALAGRDWSNVGQWAATAEACDELNRPNDATQIWERATAVNPTREVRDAAARWFEQREMYSAAVPHLEWLSDRSPADVGLRDRLAAARHGAELRRVIGR
ncbi:MAG: O-antigen ligase family protein [Fimbriiglobus sp.]|jgi:O-antigen ligase|nr:O-antigen ligase family protein [Fimbriiglobus sp.]